MSKRGRKQFATAPTSPFSKSTKSSSSVHPYGADWPSISDSIRKRDGFKCRAADIGLPKCSNVFRPPFHHLLHVHHIIPYAQIKRHVPRLLITLCKDCHSRHHDRLLGKEITHKQKIAAAKFK